MTRFVWIGSIGLTLALSAAVVPRVLAARQPDQAVDRGRQLFRTHCATCHGTTGHGDGPMVQYLRVRPADLTAFAFRNKGAFPAEAVHRAIDGRHTVRLHGDPAMPIWGDVFSPDVTANQRIDDLVAYIEAIQERSGND
jgi:mono/diheme cytochrome c family protein